MRPPPEPKPTPRYRVLVVDDDPAILRTVEGILGDEMDVVTCTSGLQAMMLIQTRTFEVVCCDYLMPGMNGIEVLRAVGEAQEDASCLLITSAADFVTELDRKRHYMMLKPFEPDRLLGLVAQLARIAHMKRSVKATASRLSSVPERPSSRLSSLPPPPSSRRSELPPRSAPPSSGGLRRSIPPSSVPPRSFPPSSSVPPRSAPPSSGGPPRSRGGGSRD